MDRQKTEDELNKDRRSLRRLILILIAGVIVMANLAVGLCLWIGGRG